MQGIEELTSIIEPAPLPDFVETKFVKALAERALGYIKAGFPVHFRGASGTGKTTLALHVASKLKRPVVMIHGNGAGSMMVVSSSMPCMNVPYTLSAARREMTPLPRQ